MKKLLLLLLLLPLFFLPSHAEEARTSAVLKSYNIWIKPGHRSAFDKAMAAHIRQFHGGDPHWRIYDVLTGPDGGSLQVIEGPRSWTEFEEHGDTDEKQLRDYEANVLPHIEKTSPVSYVEYKPEFSTTAVDNFSSKALVVHVHPKAGQYPMYLASLKEFKPVWEKLGLNMAVYASVYSGDRSVILVQRLKNGLKDFEPNGSNVRAAYDSIHGAGSYEKRSEEQLHMLDSLVTSLIAFRQDLTAK